MIKKITTKKKAAKKKAVKRTGVKAGDIQYQMFVREYLKDFNASRAAIAVGYSKKSSCMQGSRLLKNDKIISMLKVEAEKALRRNDIEVDKVLADLKILGYSSMADYAEWGAGSVTLKNSDAIPRELLAAVSEVSQQETKYGSNIRIKLHDKKGSLDTLAKIAGLLKDNLKIDQDQVDDFKNFMREISGAPLGPPSLHSDK